jgi:hypothetical protein
MLAQATGGDAWNRLIEDVLRMKVKSWTAVVSFARVAVVRVTRELKRRGGADSCRAA